MGYLEVSDLKNKVVLDAIKNCTDDNQIQYLIDYCTLLIKAYTKVDFTSHANESKLVTCDGEQIIALPQRMYNLTQVYDIVHSIDYTDHAILLDDGKQILIRELISSSRQFKNLVINNHNYREPNEDLYQFNITGDWGWANVPEDVINCLVILCNQNFDKLTNPETISKMGSPFISEKLGNYQYQLRSSYNGSTTQDEVIQTTGDPYVDQVLDLYRISDYSIEVI